MQANNYTLRPRRAAVNRDLNTVTTLEEILCTCSTSAGAVLEQLYKPVFTVVFRIIGVEHHVICQKV